MYMVDQQGRRQKRRMKTPAYSYLMGIIKESEDRKGDKFQGYRLIHERVVIETYGKEQSTDKDI